MSKSRTRSAPASRLPISIADVARRANVSISTVSRVLNRRTVVNAKTRTRVQSAIDELGYHPNAFARALMLGRSEILGLFLPDLHGEFYSEIIRGASNAARAQGYRLVVSSARDVEDSGALLNSLRQPGLLDGVAIMVSELDDHLRRTLADVSLPLVLLDDEVSGTPHECVLIDQHAGAMALMRHLIEKHSARRVIFIGGHARNVDTIARLETWRHELDRAKLSAGAADVYHLDYGYESAFELARRELPNWKGARHFVFAANDEMAAGVIAAAVHAGVRVPQDLGVVGFDDTRVARMTRPAITTVRVPMSEMGAKAIELLIERSAEPAAEPRRIVLSPQLIVRASCGCHD